MPGTEFYQTCVCEGNLDIVGGVILPPVPPRFCAAAFEDGGV